MGRLLLFVLISQSGTFIHNRSIHFLGIFWPVYISMRTFIGRRELQRMVKHIPRLFGQNTRWVKKLLKKELSHKHMVIMLHLYSSLYYINKDSPLLSNMEINKKPIALQTVD